MALLTIGGQKVNEDSYRFPSPDLTIQSVTRKEALKSLGSKGMKQGYGIVYFYLDRGYRENNVIYIGETGNSIQSRHNATHSKSQWFANLRYPLIGIVQSPYRRWDTDTRRAIEAQVIYELRKLGFAPSNHENSTWKDGVDFSVYDEQAYLESVVEKIVEYVVFHIGFNEGDTLLGTASSTVLEHPEDTPSSTALIESEADIANHEPATPEEVVEEEQVHDTPKRSSHRRKINLHSYIWDKPVQGRRLFYFNKKRNISAYAYQTEDGKTVLIRVENLPPVAASYVGPVVKTLHKRLLSTSTEDEGGRLNWEGSTEPISGSTALSAAVGSSISKMEWEEISPSQQ